MDLTKYVSSVITLAIAFLSVAPLYPVFAQDTGVSEAPLPSVSAPRANGSISRSEAFFQAAPQSTIVSLSPTYQETRTQATSISVPSSSYSFNRFSSLSKISVEHGLPSASVRVVTDYGTDVSSSTGSRDSRSEGLSDINIGFQMFLPVKDQRIYLGANANVSPAIRKESSADVMGNRFSGGNSITPGIGYEYVTNSPIVLGATAGYKINGQSQSESRDKDGTKNYESTSKGGNTFVSGIFGEYRRPAFIVGLGAEYQAKESAQTEYISFPSNFRSTSYSDALNFADASVYSVVKLNSNVEITGKFYYLTVLDQERQGVRLEFANMTSTTLGVRIAL